MLFSRAAAKRASQRKRRNPGGAAGDTAGIIRLRVNVARGTRRLDLSTWANRKEGDFLLSRVPKMVCTDPEAILERVFPAFDEKFPLPYDAFVWPIGVSNSRLLLV